MARTIPIKQVAAPFRNTKLAKPDYGVPQTSVLGAMLLVLNAQTLMAVTFAVFCLF